MKGDLMKSKKAINQLQDLKLDRKSFIIGDKEHDKIFEDDVEAIDKVLYDLEIYKIITKKQIAYLDKQIRCYERKINDILELKNQGRYLTAKERKQLKYEVGRKDECVKMKNHLMKLIERSIRENVSITDKKEMV